MDWLRGSRPTHANSLIFSNTQSCLQWLQTSPSVVSNLGDKKEKFCVNPPALFWLKKLHQLYEDFNQHSLFNKLKRWFLHDSTDTGQVPPLDPVADDGSSDDLCADLGAARGYVHRFFSGNKQRRAVMSLQLHFSSGFNHFKRACLGTIKVI